MYGFGTQTSIYLVAASMFNTIIDNSLVEEIIIRNLNQIRNSHITNLIPGLGITSLKKNMPNFKLNLFQLPCAAAIYKIWFFENNSDNHNIFLSTIS